MKKSNIFTAGFITFLTIISIIGYSCDKNEDNNTDSSTTTITVSAFTLNNGVYTNTGNILTFDSEADCQTWSRNSLDTIHGNNGAHLHFNAATNVSYNSTDTIFTYTEYGPELDQAAIDSTCAVADSSGVTKTVTASTYYQDKPNVYLKITNVD